MAVLSASLSTLLCFCRLAGLFCYMNRSQSCHPQSIHLLGARVLLMWNSWLSMSILPPWAFCPKEVKLTWVSFSLLIPSVGTEAELREPTLGCGSEGPETIQGLTRSWACSSHLGVSLSLRKHLGCWKTYLIATTGRMLLPSTG